MVVIIYSNRVYVVVNVIKEKIMGNYPNWYMTVDEFAALVADTVYECGYFNRDDRVHPEDIEAAFSSIATAVSKGASFVGKKVGGSSLSFKKVEPSESVTTQKIGYQNKTYYTTNSVANENTI